MRIAHSETTPWGPVRSTRGGVIKFKTLLEGREGRPDNYQLLLADTDPSFKSPRHRHNFDQVRFALTGATNIGPKRNLEPATWPTSPRAPTTARKTRKKSASKA
jgi:hypothetical protein